MDHAVFLVLVKNACSRLRQNGYSLDSATMDVQPTYTSVIIPGRNWTITFTCDFRDEAVDCYVRGAGEAASSDVKLVRFLIDNFQYRGNAHAPGPASESFDSKVHRLVRRHAATLEHYAAPVWHDRPAKDPASD